MMRQLLRCLFLLLCGALLAAPARADTPVTLLKSFAGNVNFTGTEVTMRTNTTCAAEKPQTKLSRTLSGIPSGAQVLAAYLYWAGSSATADYQVSFEGRNVTATRKYTSRYANGGVNYDYFGGAVEVTTQVAAKGNGTYTFSGLTINTGNPYCNVQGVLGGFALLVIYSSPSTEPYRVLNVYEGFQNMRYNSIALNVSNFRVPNPIGTASGRLGHITWEGDLSLYQQGEDLIFNDVVMNDPAINPSGNQFNSQSSINNDKVSYGIDFDAYDIKYPIIQPDQTAASTLYRSGQDMVLLNVEIVAVPNVAVADLGVALTRTGNPYTASSVSYVATVTNNGPEQNPASSPITFTERLATGMTFVSASGTGWTCSQSGGYVTCTYATALAKGASAPPITVVANVSNASSYPSFTTTATVAGQLFDNNSLNDSASDTAINPVTGSAPYTLTLGPCQDGVPFTTAGQCKPYSGPYLAADTATQLYITALANGVPSKKNTTSSFRFSLSCVDPTTHANVAASFGGVVLPTCLSNGATPTTSTAWSTNALSVSFANSPSSSVPFTFIYKDVGYIQLNMYDVSGGKIATARFTSVPEKLVMSVARGGVANPGGLPMVGVLPTHFAMAGEEFDINIQVAMKDGNGPPNFGKETTPSVVALGQDVAPAVTGSLGKLATAGLYSGKFRYAEAGDINLTARLATSADPGANHYFGYLVDNHTLKVGTFYPAYFKTAVTTDFDCISPAMGCPTGLGAGGEDLAVGGAAYSGQQFDVAVTAHGLTSATPLARWAVPTGAEVTLQAQTLPGPSGTVPGFGSLQGAVSITNVAVGAPMAASPSFNFSGTPALKSPETVYVRASTTLPVAGKGNVTVSSRRDAPDVAVEDGVRVLLGRIQVGSNAGSETQKLALALRTQFFNGTAWENNTQDSSTTIASSAAFTNCTNKLRTAAAAPNNCNTALVAPFDATPITFAAGQATFWLKAPGSGNTGTATVRMSPGQPWLPSETGTAAFGTTARHPMIYIREVH